MVEEAAVPLQPRKVERGDRRKVSAQLKAYYGALLKMYEPDTEAFFERVMMIVERDGRRLT